MLSRWFCFLTWTGIVAIGPVSALGAVVDVDSWRLITRAGDFMDGPGEMEVAEEAAALPFEFTRTVQMGASSSTSTYSFARTPSGARFQFEFDQVRDGDKPAESRGDFARSSGHIYFRTTREMEYVIDGSYALAGMPNGMQLTVTLLDAPVQGIIYHSFQFPAGVPNQVFNVGGMDGGLSNELIGSTSGMLSPGEYLFSYVLTIGAATADNGASASGWLEFHIIPEPSAAVMAAAAVTFLLRYRG